MSSRRFQPGDLALVLVLASGAAVSALEQDRGSLHVQTYEFDPSTPSGRGAPVQGALVRTNGRIVGETAAEGSLLTSMPAGDVLVEAFVPCFAYGQTTLSVLPGDQLRVDLILDDKEVSEDSQLVGAEMEGNVLPSSAQSLTLRFERNGTFIPIAHVVGGGVFLEPTATREGMVLTDLFTVAPDGSLSANDITLLRAALGGRAEVQITASAVDRRGLCQVDTLSFELPVTPGHAPPVADAGLDQDVECDRAMKAVVSLDGSASTGPSGDPLEFLWFLNDGSVLGTSAVVEARLGVGAHVVRLGVNDHLGGADSDTVSVIVRDTEPVVIRRLNATPETLWPPNHKLVDVLVSYEAQDTCDPSPGCVLAVMSNEPENGTGDGDTGPDWQVIDAHRLKLRSERAGTGSGRVYTITISCSDVSGNRATNSVTVSVPKNNKSK